MKELVEIISLLVNMFNVTEVFNTVNTTGFSDILVESNQRHFDYKITDNDMFIFRFIMTMDLIVLILVILTFTPRKKPLLPIVTSDTFSIINVSDIERSN
jgi:hypothetical protein